MKQNNSFSIFDSQGVLSMEPSTAGTTTIRSGEGRTGVLSPVTRAAPHSHVTRLTGGIVVPA